MYTLGNFTGNTIAMVLAGGKGERLSPVTLNKPKPCVPFGGKYKIIDFVLSNMFNSGLKKVYILTQYRAYALNKHIKDSWANWTGLGEFYDTISPETSSSSEAWFRGTADAIFQFLRCIEASDADYVAIFGGDHIYKMDISQMISYHILNKADITLAALEVSEKEGKEFGIISVDAGHRVTEFTEKPTSPHKIPGKNTCFASMGNYIFSKQKLIEILTAGKKEHEDLDFGKHVIPMMLAKGDRVFAYNFMDNVIPGMNPEEKGYWKDVGTLDSYYEANMDLIRVDPQLNLYNYKWPIITNQGNSPPAKTVFEEGGRCGQNINSYICGGCINSGGTVRRSVVGPHSHVHSHSLIEDSILFSNVEIGRNTRIKKAIIDENVVIPDNCEIGYNHEEDRRNGYTITESGIVIVAQ